MAGFKIADAAKFIFAPVNSSLTVFHWLTMMFMILVCLMVGLCANFHIIFWVPNHFSDCISVSLY
jgi:hypothetical protein